LSLISAVAEKNFRLNPGLGDLQVLTGVRYQVASLVSVFANSVGNATYTLFLLLGLRLLLRNQWLAIAVESAIFAGLGAANSPLPWFSFGISFLLNGLLLFFLVRYGYLATVVVLGGYFLLMNFPPDLNWGNWYAPSGTLSILLFAAIILYGFRTATAGQKGLSEDLE